MTHAHLATSRPGVPLCGQDEPNSSIVLNPSNLTCVECIERITPQVPGPIALYLTCPKCNTRHIDEGEFAFKPHHTHACQCCGLTWRPAIVHTRGVAFLPGFKNEK